ncbi:MULTISPECIES: hypothetical protein [Haloarcula]|uniref:hypothetical protein n=1 Tax=Haloarcula TaxID=2237 RepID=UPI000F8C35A8|nr:MULTISPECIES: hypothetical protein [Haloarcula]NHX41416.1 hypothetical protein [Haloarcula sp. R1-2]
MAIHPDVSDTEDSDESDTEDSDESDNDESIRNKKQYSMYLDEELQEELDDIFKKFNARRKLNDEPHVEKNRHFHQGLIEAALLDADWEDYVERRFEKTSE